MGNISDDSLWLCCTYALNIWQYSLIDCCRCRCCFSFNSRKLQNYGWTWASAHIQCSSSRFISVFHCAAIEIPAKAKDRLFNQELDVISHSIRIKIVQLQYLSETKQNKRRMRCVHATAEHKNEKEMYPCLWWIVLEVKCKTWISHRITKAYNSNINTFGKLYAHFKTVELNDNGLMIWHTFGCYCFVLFYVIEASQYAAIGECECSWRIERQVTFIYSSKRDN